MVGRAPAKNRIQSASTKTMGGVNFLQTMWSPLMQVAATALQLPATHATTSMHQSIGGRRLDWYVNGGFGW